MYFSSGQTLSVKNWQNLTVKVNSLSKILNLSEMNFMKNCIVMYFPETISFLYSSAIQKMMFRVAFHGGIGNFWKALMTIPEVIYLFNSAFKVQWALLVTLQVKSRFCSFIEI